jgi:hypothetical protein
MRINLEMTMDQSKFKPHEKQAEAFWDALGYMVNYGFRMSTEDASCTVRGRVTIGADMSDVEIVCSYERPSGSRFVMVAIAGKAGTEYSFHS